jgi:hypothetical protein
MAGFWIPPAVDLGYLVLPCYPSDACPGGMFNLCHVRTSLRGRARVCVCVFVVWSSGASALSAVAGRVRRLGVLGLRCRPLLPRPCLHGLRISGDWFLDDGHACVRRAPAPADSLLHRVVCESRGSRLNLITLVAHRNPCARQIEVVCKLGSISVMMLFFESRTMRAARPRAVTCC